MKRKILIVDDERRVVRLLQVTLERAGYATSVAYNGRDALERVAAEKPDMLILDILMPDMDGYAVLRCLRRDPETRDLPVFMLTAKSDDASVRHCLGVGANVYLTKPFNPRELVMFIDRVFAQPHELNPA